MAYTTAALKVALLVLLALLADVSASERGYHSLGQSDVLSMRRQIFVAQNHSRLVTNDQTAIERIKRSQVIPRAIPNKVAKRHASDPQPSVKTCPRPSQEVCNTNSGGSDGCLAGHYSVSASGVTLLDGTTFNTGDRNDMNYKYISCHDYCGTGTYHNTPSNWNVHSSNVHIEQSRNNQYIGQLTLPFADAGSTFGSEGWCIIWVQLQGFNQHFGEGGQLPFCTSQCNTKCPPKKRRLPGL